MVSEREQDGAPTPCRGERSTPDGGAVPATDPTEALVEDERRLAAFADELADGVRAALPRWVVRSVHQRYDAWAGGVPAEVASAAEAAGQRAADDVGQRVADLLAMDVDDQWTNPLAIVRTAVRWPTRVLDEAGVPPVVRDALAEQHFPDDVYDLVPGAFADLDEGLHEPGLVWGAAKAHVVLARRRAEGRR